MLGRLFKEQNVLYFQEVRVPLPLTINVVRWNEEAMLRSRTDSLHEGGAGKIQTEMDKRGGGKKKKGVSLLDTPLGNQEGPSSSMSMNERRGTFFGDRRVSVAESARRSSWLERTRHQSLQMRNRGRLLYELRFPELFFGLYSVRFSPDGSTMATGFGSGAIQVRNPDNGEIRATLRAGMDQTFPIMCIRYHPMKPDMFFAASTDGLIYICNAVHFDFSKYAEETKNEVNAIDTCLSGDIMATAGKDAAIRLYDVDSGKVKSIYKQAGLNPGDNTKFHRMRVFALRFHPNQRDIFVSGGWDDMVKVWDVRVPDGCIRNIRGPHICGDSIDLKENVVATGSWVVANSLQLWDLTTTKLIETVMPANRVSTMDGEFLYALQYFDGDPYGETICVGGSGTGFLEVINLKEKRVFGSFPVSKPLQCIDSRDNTIVFGGMEPVLRIGEYA